MPAPIPASLLTAEGPSAPTGPARGRSGSRSGENFGAPLVAGLPPAPARWALRAPYFSPSWRLQGATLRLLCGSVARAGGAGQPPRWRTGSRQSVAGGFCPAAPASMQGFWGDPCTHARLRPNPCTHATLRGKLLHPRTGQGQIPAPAQGSADDPCTHATLRGGLVRPRTGQGVREEIMTRAARRRRRGAAGRSLSPVEGLEATAETASP